VPASESPFAHFASLVCGSRESAQLLRSLLEQIIGSRQACSEAAGSGVPVAPWGKTNNIIKKLVLVSSYKTCFNINRNFIYYTNNPTTEMLEQVTNVFLYSSYMSVPLLILRTSMRIERQLSARLAVDVQLPAAAGYLHRIEHVQLDTAETRDRELVVQVRGLTMRKQKIETGVCVFRTCFITAGPITKLFACERGG